MHPLALSNQEMNSERISISKITSTTERFRGNSWTNITWLEISMSSGYRMWMDSSLVRCVSWFINEVLRISFHFKVNLSLQTIRDTGKMYVQIRSYIMLLNGYFPRNSWEQICHIVEGNSGSVTAEFISVTANRSTLLWVDTEINVSSLLESCTRWFKVIFHKL